MNLLDTFEKILPGRTAAGPAEPEPAADKRAQITVLVIDDDPLFRQRVCSLLRHDGYSAVSSNTGKKGLEMVSFAPNIDAVLLNYQLPEVSGVETLARLRKYWPKLKTVGVSGVDPEKIEKPFLSGVDWFLRKPFQDYELVETLDRLFNLDLAILVEA